MKSFVMCIALFLCVSCASWKALTPTEKVSTTVEWYQTFSNGLRTVSNSLDTREAAIAYLALAVLDNSVESVANMLKERYSHAEVMEQLKIVDGAAQTANAVVGGLL